MTDVKQSTLEARADEGLSYERIYNGEFDPGSG